MTTIRDSLFSFIYALEAIIPSKIQEPTIQFEIVQGDNDDLRRDYLLSEEKTESALIRIKSQNRTSQ